MPSLTTRDIKDMHLQLRHGRATAFTAYIFIAKMWHDDMANLVDSIVKQCPDRSTFHTTPLTKAPQRPPSVKHKFASTSNIWTGRTIFM